jgi:hypothetical protein
MLGDENAHHDQNDKQENGGPHCIRVGVFEVFSGLMEFSRYQT